jgi:very-short-patch-repair endonuclease
MYNDHVDAFLPEYNVVVQFDGDYWHGNPSKFANLNKRQIRRQKLDRSRDAYFAKCSIPVLRFWESDMHHSRETCVEQLKKLLSLEDCQRNLSENVEIDVDAIKKEKEEENAASGKPPRFRPLFR